MQVRQALTVAAAYERRLQPLLEAVWREMRHVL
jgi:hypothetical protein